MTFNSLEFLVFFPTVAALFFGLPHRARGPMLLLASFLFYGWWSPVYLLLMLGTASVDWWVAEKITDSVNPAVRRRWLAASLISNLGVLFGFKYYNLVNDTAIDLAGTFGYDWLLPRSNLVLPVGISFYTFQSLSYTFDVYRRAHPPERSWWFFLLYVSYFPQLVAGPIERADRLLPQLHREATWDADRVASGLRLACWGMFKKVAVADRLAEFVSLTYGDLDHVGALAMFFGTVAFAYQVLTDFSGYTDIARGVARVLGVELINNFDQPYLSRSMAELWSRWHISMTTWFRDYVFIPLGGSRVSTPRWAVNVMTVFLLSGLWHGAAWHYVAWGCAHGLLLIAERLTQGPRTAFQRAIGLPSAPWLEAFVQWLCCWLAWMFTLTFFRAETVGDALRIVFHVVTGWLHPHRGAFADFLHDWRTDPGALAYLMALIVAAELVEFGFRDPGVRARVATFPAPARWVLDWSVVFGALLLGAFGDVPFIYFQF